MENLLSTVRQRRSFTKREREQPGRLPGLKPVAIVDIGSNSVRLVVYEGLIRVPTQLFNEKEMLELGRPVAETGRIAEAAIEETCRVLSRFQLLCEEMEVDEIYPIATAAARDAENSDEFIERASDALGVPIRLISGEEEARLAAMGVISGFWRASGIVGDMGGGSLELLHVENDKPEKGTTLPLGALKLKASADGDLGKARKIAAAELKKAPFLAHGKGEPFYAIGGTWRSIAHLHMLQTSYPMSVIHDYRIPAPQALEFIASLQSEKLDGLKFIGEVSSKRKPLLPYGAVVMEAVLKATRASEVVFSANGVREGVMYELLPAGMRGRDPLLAAAADLGYLRSRSPQYAVDIAQWSAPLFASGRINETAAEARLRQAACYLSDIGWRAHPDYKGEQSFSTLMNAALSGADHQGRAFLAFVNYLRYGGASKDVPASVAPLIDARAEFLARTLSATMRVAYVIAASMPGVLPRSALSFKDGKLVLQLGRGQKALAGRRLESRLQTLAKLLDAQSEIKA